MFAGLSEALALEVSSFNIRVLLVEPGAFRTGFLSSTSLAKAELSSSYAGTIVDNTLKKFDDANGNQRGDPAKAASRIFDVVTKSGAAAGLGKEYLRLPLGVDSIQRLEKKIRSLQETVDDLRSLGSDMDV